MAASCTLLTEAVKIASQTGGGEAGGALVDNAKMRYKTKVYRGRCGNVTIPSLLLWLMVAFA